MCIPLPETNTFPEKANVEDDFPLPKVGCVSSLEGIYLDLLENRAISALGDFGQLLGDILGRNFTHLEDAGSFQSPNSGCHSPTQDAMKILSQTHKILGNTQVEE